MTVMLQLNPALPVRTPKGTGLAHFLLDYGVEHDVLWGVVDDATGEVWWVANPDVRGVKNYSMRAIRESKIKPHRKEKNR